MELESNLKTYPDEMKDQTTMSSSTVSSLASPGDSGVQLLDSESEITSVMSVSGFECDCDPKLDKNEDARIIKSDKDQKNVEVKHHIMTKSDIANQNIIHDIKALSSSVPNYFDKFDFTKRLLDDDIFEMEHPIQSVKAQQDENVMNVSLNSYELLDYTIQNTDQMHISMSEEVNESLNIKENAGNVVEVSPLPVVVEAEPKQEEQIVFRRQRKKKSKSDTPKKRVSFHEDILNSTKIDDIHINHGFITHEDEVSFSFFQRGFKRKPDVVKGRYSWAAEGDAPYYESTNNRETKSDLYSTTRYSSTSSTSTGSSSSVDEEDSDDINNKREPLLHNKQPKSSCLKKSKNKKHIDTKIVHEEIPKKQDSINLLDTNIFGSLKNILNFSTSVPLAERGVPEGQEDVTIYASDRRRSQGNLSLLKNFEIKPAKVEAPVLSQLSQAKASLKLTKSEGFYPNYPAQNLPANIIVCDSNVYEHKGISYSYEYQKNFEEQEKKPKSSTVYQMILKEFNFFRKKAKQTEAVDDDFEIIEDRKVVEEVEETEVKLQPLKINKYASSTKLDWSDDNETIMSDLSENPSRHLLSPKKKINRNNHFQIQPGFNFNNPDGAESVRSLRSASSKTSLINRFLRNVTLKKMLDAKAKQKQSNGRYMGLYIKGVKGSFQADDLDKLLEQEIIIGRDRIQNGAECFDKKMLVQFRKEVFRSRLEKLIRVFSVRSAYTTTGESKSLLVILTDSTLYITGSKANCYCNHFVLPFTELNTILVGPNAQTIHFSNYDKDMQCIVTTGCSNITGDLIGQLEMAMRRDANKPRLAAVKQLSMVDMVNLRRAICKQTSVLMEEDYYFYSIVNIQDFVSDAIETPLGPSKEGPLMFKTADQESRWETAYFILKAGVLYMLSSASQRVPMSVFPLINGSCHGARRVFNSHRPHTFQVIVEGKQLHLAAPDEYVASEWLQEIIHAASGTYNYREKAASQSCSLLMTSEHIVTVREAFPCTISSLASALHDPIKGAQALSCAAIMDLTSFRLPSAEQSWCVLEFACREVHEYSGDWILYFASNAELEVFISTLEMLWAYNNEQGDSFPLSTIPETDPLSQKCVDVYTSLMGNWVANTVHLQFL